VLPTARPWLRSAATALLSAALLLAPAAALAQSSSGGTADGTAPAAASTAGQAQFTDITGNWAEGDIEALLEGGVLTVPPSGQFDPTAPVTRVDFTVWLARAMELTPATTPLPFKDAAEIPTDEQPEVAAALAAGIVQGYPGNVFLPEAPITRAQIATLLGRVLQSKGQTPQARFFDLFPDGSTIPSWALPAALVVQDQIMYGEPCSPSPCFAPTLDTSRAEAATMIVRFLQYLTATYHSAPLPQPTAAAPFVFGEWYSDTDEAYSNLQEYGSAVNELIYGGYDIQAGGTLVGFDSPRTLAWASAHSGTALWVMIQASSLSFLGNATQTDTLLASVIQMVQRAGYAGVNFDIEGVPGSDRAEYTAFITQAASDLHAIGAKISVAVPSEESSDLGEWFDEAYDYPALGQVVDQLIMMAYDYHYAGGPPGPISPISWDQAVIDYASSVMPPDKVILGMPAYGYIWNTATDAGTAYWVSGMQAMAADFGATITHDAAADEGTFSYQSGGNSYVGWFVDGQGAADRLALAHKAGIGGVMVWRMDYDTPSWWPAWMQDLAQWN